MQPHQYTRSGALAAIVFSDNLIAAGGATPANVS